MSVGARQIYFLIQQTFREYPICLVLRATNTDRVSTLMKLSVGEADVYQMIPQIKTSLQSQARRQSARSPRSVSDLAGVGWACGGGFSQRTHPVGPALGEPGGNGAGVALGATGKNIIDQGAVWAQAWRWRKPGECLTLELVEPGL